MNKKGFVQGAAGSVVGIAIAAGVLALILILVPMMAGLTWSQTQDNLDQLGNYPINGETHAIVNGTATQLNNHLVQSGTLAIYNGSNVLGLGNFSVNYDAGQVTLSPSYTFATAYNGSTVSFNYTWGVAEARTKARETMMSGFDVMYQTGSFSPVVFLALMIVVVLAVILSIQGQASGNGGGMSRGSAL